MHSPYLLDFYLAIKPLMMMMKRDRRRNAGWRADNSVVGPVLLWTSPFGLLLVVERGGLKGRWSVPALLESSSHT